MMGILSVKGPVSKPSRLVWIKDGSDVEETPKHLRLSAKKLGGLHNQITRIPTHQTNKT
jgi:hypothetical protein